METLAFTHAAVAYEDPNPAPELQINLEIPSSAWIGALSTAVVLSAVVGTAPKAEASVRFGDVCSAVSDVQATLINAGYNPGSVDGTFGSNTLSAVRRFQSNNGLDTDGVVGSQTANAMGLSGAAFQSGSSCYGGGGTGGGGGGGIGTSYVSTNGSALTVRSGPGSGYAAIDYLANGTAVTVVRQSSGWSQISGGGWVAADWLSPSGGVGGGGGGGNGGGSGGGGYYVSTNGGSLVVRSGPGFGYADIDALSNGSYVTIVRTSGGWGQLSGGGWISMDWLGTSTDGGGGGGGGGNDGNGLLTVSTNGGDLVVRSGPGAGYSAVAYLANGSSVPYSDYYGGWYEITDGGWVSANWVY